MLKSLTKSAALLGLAALSLGAVHARADDLVVQYDQARLLTLEQPAANIIVGNPSIADVTLKSTKLLIITGKTFGVTNLMVLNDEDKVIYSARLMVKSDESKVVTLIRGDAKNTFACVPQCEPVLKVGDEQKFYAETATAAQQKLKFSEGTDAAAQQASN
jgi:hypothetical protein